MMGCLNWYFTDQNKPKGGPRENEFWLYSNTQVNVKTVRVEKVDEKMVLSFHVSFLGYGP